MSTSRPANRLFLRLFLILYPFVTAAVAVNLFLLGLAGQFVNLTAIAPMTAIYLALPLGLPATWLTVRWVRRLVAEAER